MRRGANGQGTTWGEQRDELGSCHGNATRSRLANMLDALILLPVSECFLMEKPAVAAESPPQSVRRVAPGRVGSGG